MTWISLGRVFATTSVKKSMAFGLRLVARGNEQIQTHLVACGCTKADLFMRMGNKICIPPR